MARQVDFRLDIRAFSAEVLNSDFVLEEITRTAEAIQARAGEGYAASSKHGRKRALAMVYTDTPDAMRDNNRNNTLLKAMGGRK